MYDPILVATDGSTTATHAAAHAIDIAATYGATLHALHVVDVRLVETVPQRDRLEEATHLDAIRTDAAGADLSCVTALRRGTPHRGVLDYASEVEADADLVVVGTRGTTGIQRFLLGSTADRLVRLSPVPVVVVPPRSDPVPPPA